MSAIVETVARRGAPEPVTVFGLSPAVRLARQLARLTTRDGFTLLIGADVVVDTPALKYLVDHEALIVTDSAGRPLIAWLSAVEAELLRDAFATGQLPLQPPCRTARAGSFDFASGLKKREQFQAFALDLSPVRTVEDALYYASYKGVTDLVTKFAWPRPALAVVRACVALRISPNMVTGLSILLSIAALPIFVTGHLLLGLLCAWGMTFLDTVDGKLARVTVSYSSFGNYFDHIPDLLFPPLWWLAYMFGLQRFEPPTIDATLWSCFWIVIASYIVGRLCEGAFTLRHKFEPFVWRPSDARFRLVLARRNPNLLILTAAVLIGQATLGYYVLAAWCGICALVQLWNFAEAELARGRRGRLTSFLQDAPATP
jgi:phosphatidylglycerophosphate synthase